MDQMGGENKQSAHHREFTRSSTLSPIETKHEDALIKFKTMMRLPKRESPNCVAILTYCAELSTANRYVKIINTYIVFYLSIDYYKTFSNFLYIFISF